MHLIYYQGYKPNTANLIAYFHWGPQRKVKILREFNIYTYIQIYAHIHMYIHMLTHAYTYIHMA